MPKPPYQPCIPTKVPDRPEVRFCPVTPSAAARGFFDVVSQMRRSPDHVDASIPRAIYALVIFPVVLPAYGLTSQEVVAKLEAAGYSQIREMTAGKIMTYKAVRGGKEVFLVIDSFGKVKEFP
jgi:hypothetical protein